LFFVTFCFFFVFFYFFFFFDEKQDAARIASSPRVDRSDELHARRAILDSRAVERRGISVSFCGAHHRPDIPTYPRTAEITGLAARVPFDDANVVCGYVLVADARSGESKS